MGSKTEIVPMAGSGLALIAPELEAAREYILAGVPKNTQRAYAADWAAFSEWCEDHRQAALPASPATIAAYLSSQARGLKASTLRRRLAAIAKMHSVKGHPNPCGTAPVKATMRGIEATIGTRAQGKAPVTNDALTRMIDGYGTRTDLDALRARALLLVGFAGAFRRSELSDLRMNDLTWSPEGVVILVRKSKTDQRGEGLQKAVPYIGGRMCAAGALAAWVRAVGSGDGPVFRPILRTGTATIARPLSTQSIALIIKVSAERVGIDPGTVSGHSLRAGHVTEARSRGIADAATMQTTGHKRVETLEMYDRRNNPFSKGSAASVLRPKE